MEILTKALGTSMVLGKEYQYYLDNQQELYNKYAGKVLVIVGENVVGVYEDELEALIASSKKYELGTFLIQRCEQTVEPQKFYSRVSFS